MRRFASVILAIGLHLFDPFGIHAREKVFTNASWTIPLNDYTDSSPALAPDGTIYFGTFSGKFWALNPNGTEKWTFQAASEIRSSPAVAKNGTIHFGSRDRKLYALNPKGGKQWEFKTGGWIDSSPAIADNGDIVAGSWDGNVYAVKPDGGLRWKFAVGAEITSSPAIGSDGSIYFGGHDHKFYALTSDGKQKWTFETGGAIISSPALNGEECLYFTSIDGWIYALGYDGRLKWKAQTGGIGVSSPVIGLDGTICVGANSKLWAGTPEGKERWVRNIDKTVDAPPVMLQDGSVCWISRYGLLLDIDMERNVLWYYYCEGYGAASPAVTPNGTVVLSDKGLCFSAVPAGMPLARSPWPKFRGGARNTGNVKDLKE